VRHGVIEASSYEPAAATLVTLRSQPQGAVISQFLNISHQHKVEPSRRCF